MSTKRKAVLWEAKPHTIAKISILKSYLSRWFEIIGRTFSGKDLWYIDGFAGPGEYTNSPTGSPVAAINSASETLQKLGAQWKAGHIHCVFIEQDTETFLHLQDKLNSLDDNPKIHPQFLNEPFVNGLATLEKQKHNPFSSQSPLFAFIDPFGAKGVPFAVIKDLLSRGTVEILINFDSDGIGRIFQAAEAANHREILAEIFGDDSWKAELSKHRASHELYRGVLDLYKQKLLALPNIRYVFAFEMRSAKNILDYHLVFASQHHKGLEKMKEAMKTIAESGDFSFSDAHVNQPSLFNFNDPALYGDQLFKKFCGKTVSYSQVRDYALNESPFINPKSMLKYLEVDKDVIQVKSNKLKRRKGTFAEESEQITFRQGN